MKAPRKEVWLITGGAGFIGCNFVLNERRRGSVRIVNLDKLTYAGNLQSLQSLADDPDHIFIQGDIGDADLVGRLLKTYRPVAVINFAAESHVDRSILSPCAFLETNVVGTFKLLQAALGYWRDLPDTERERFRFLHVSTDEVFGSLQPEGPPFRESNPYRPNSPYAASKAAADHFVRAFFHTYGLPVLTTNCSNNYGPYQFAEKLIPLMIQNAKHGESLPVYGDGQQVRDWLYVVDHCDAIRVVLDTGSLGETYNIGGRAERTNLEVVRQICGYMDEFLPNSPHRPFEKRIAFVTDRPGHDRRYAIDDEKIRTQLGWAARESFESGLRKTIRWYLDNQRWVESVRSGEYKNWIRLNYEQRANIIR